MDFISDYIFWIIFFLTIVSIFLYKKITKDPNAVTAKHIAILDLENKNITHEDILEAMKSSKFKIAICFAVTAFGLFVIRLYKKIERIVPKKIIQKMYSENNSIVMIVYRF